MWPFGLFFISYHQWFQLRVESKLYGQSSRKSGAEERKADLSEVWWGVFSLPDVMAVDSSKWSQGLELHRNTDALVCGPSATLPAARSCASTGFGLRRAPLWRSGLMSLPVRNFKCLSPVMCQCKVICSNRTLSLMFGCKVRWKRREKEEEMASGGIRSRKASAGIVFDCTHLCICLVSVL